MSLGLDYGTDQSGQTGCLAYPCARASLFWPVDLLKLSMRQGASSGTGTTVSSGAAVHGGYTGMGARTGAYTGVYTGTCTWVHIAKSGQSGKPA